MIGGGGEIGEFGVDAAQVGVGEFVVDVPLEPLAGFGSDLLEGLFAAGDLCFGLADVVGEAVDLLGGGGLLLAAVAAELGEGAEPFEAFVGAAEPVLGPVQVLLGVLEGQFGLAESGAPVGRPVLEKGPELGSFGEKPLPAGGSRFVDGEARVGLAAEGVEDFAVGGALVGEDPAVVDLR